MNSSTAIVALFIVATLGATATQAIAIDEIHDRYMNYKGGVLYPHTGDSSQERFQTPLKAMEMFPPGTLIGVLPADCVSASKGTVGNYYRCDHGFALKEEMLPDGRTAYRVIEAP